MPMSPLVHTKEESTLVAMQPKPMAISSITSPSESSCVESSFLSMPHTKPNPGITSLPPTYAPTESTLMTGDLFSSATPDLPSPYPASITSSISSSPSELHGNIGFRGSDMELKSPRLMDTLSPPHRYGEYHAYGRLSSNRQKATGRYGTSSLVSDPFAGAMEGMQSISQRERRERNKAASAKYRAKKNQQHGEMRGLIAALTRENELLHTQIEHCHRENERLKTTCDRLRGKMMAEKMLKRMLHEKSETGTDSAMKDSDFDLKSWRRDKAAVTETQRSNDLDADQESPNLYSDMGWSDGAETAVMEHDGHVRTF